MTNVSDIRNLFQPMQPAVSQHQHDIAYNEAAPAPCLRHLIHCYWELKTVHRLRDPFRYNVVADGCIDIFFELSEPQDSYVMGFASKAVQFSLGTSFHYAGIRFLPGSFPVLFRTDASDLTDTVTPLDGISSSVSATIAAVIDSPASLRVLKTRLDNLLPTLFTAMEYRPDPRVLHSIHSVLKHHGTLKIEEELACSGLSSRQLRRYYNSYIGASMKSFSRIVRFQNVLNNIPSIVQSGFPPVLYDAGYYDQSHFIREFKTFCGHAPSVILDGF